MSKSPGNNNYKVSMKERNIGHVAPTEPSVGYRPIPIRPPIEHNRTLRMPPGLPDRR